MEAYAQALNYAIPFFIFLMVIEFAAAQIMKKGDVIYMMDTLASLTSGFTNIIKDVLKLVIPILVYGWLVEHIAVVTIKPLWLAIVVTVIYKDFVGYWVHRLEHTVNYFWNRHVIHHSSEEFNLACALRQSISEFTTITTVLLIPLALIGISVEIFATVAAIHLFGQFWYHTRLIGRMGFLEKFLVTPSHHRVHHAINDEYMDKNYGQIFIIWDKMFGSFQEELDEIPPVYGVKRAAQTWNPFIINFQHLWLIIKDSWRTKSWKDKARVWFMPTGWRPADVAEKYPVASIKNPNEQVKYRPTTSNLLKVWSVIQFTFVFILMMFLFNQLGAIAIPGVYIYGLFLFVSIFAFTAAMDKKRYAIVVEVLKSVFGGAILYVYDGWFTLSEMVPALNIVIGLYLIISPMAVLYFHFKEFRNTVTNSSVSKFS